MIRFWGIGFQVQGLKSSGSESDQKVVGLQSRVEELEAWKDKVGKQRLQKLAKGQWFSLPVRVFFFPP